MPNYPHRLLKFILLLILSLGGGPLSAVEVEMGQSATEIENWDFLEVSLAVKKPTAKNPFTDVLVSGSCQKEMQPGATVHGYCDSQDGSSFKLRFMPVEPGSYNFSITYQEGSFAKNFSGTFQVRDGKRKGLLQINKDFPFHFQWAGTREPYFWNGTTSYWLLGWEDESVIQRSLERLAKLKVNHVRVALNGRTQGGARWDEPLVVTSEKDKFFYKAEPWIAKNTNSVEDPQYDTERFFLHHWHKCERMLRVARELNIVVEIIFYLDGKDKGVDPFGKDGAGGEEELLYYKHAAARLAGFSNVVWNLSNEYRLFRDDAWANTMGDYLKKCDPYDHLISIHGHHDFNFRTAAWADFASFQCWDEKGGYEYMLENRHDQMAANRIIPQVNEEYGYEDHYPQGWGEARKAPARNADSRRRIAWEISMAGCYQTTGERADQGTGGGKNTGGGWINGRGDDEMTMLKGYGLMVDFFTSFEWWKAVPSKEVIKNGKACALVEPGKCYAVYLPAGGSVELKLAAGNYHAESYQCKTGERKDLGEIKTQEWKSPSLDPATDWALLVRTR